VYHQLHERRDFWSQFTEIPEFEIDVGAITDAWSQMREAVLHAFEAKRGAPLDRIDLSPEAVRAIAAYREYAAALADAISRLRATNTAIERVKEQAAAADLNALRSDLARLRAIQSRHSLRILPLCDDYLTERDAKVARATETPWP
jgi:hypothetical protein